MSTDICPQLRHQLLVALDGRTISEACRCLQAVDVALVQRVPEALTNLVADAVLSPGPDFETRVRRAQRTVACVRQELLAGTHIDIRHLGSAAAPPATARRAQPAHN